MLNISLDCMLHILLSNVINCYCMGMWYHSLCSSLKSAVFVRMRGVPAVYGGGTNWPLFTNHPTPTQRAWPQDVDGHCLEIWLAEQRYLIGKIIGRFRFFCSIQNYSQTIQHLLSRAGPNFFLLILVINEWASTIYSHPQFLHVGKISTSGLLLEHITFNNLKIPKSQLIFGFIS